jgi:hypothetical protein
VAHGTFRSVATEQLPVSGATPGDVFFDTTRGLLFFVISDGTLLGLLQAIPFPTIGPTGLTGAQGPQGPVGPIFPDLFQFTGTWQPSPVSYQQGAVVTFSGYAYVALATLNISNNTEPPNGNPFWAIVSPIATTRSAEFIVQVDGAGITPLLGFKGFINIPFACSILSWVLTADQPGNASFDVKYCADSAFPATASVVGGTFPALASAQKSEGDISSWTKTSFVAGDKLEIDLLAAATVTFLSFSLLIAATN